MADQPSDPPAPEPRPPRPKFEFVDATTVRGSDGKSVSVLDAISALPWVDQLCPFMPHQYAINGRSPEWAWYALESMIRLNPESYRAFFRGYPSANKYWDAPDGLRYWRGRFEIDRCEPDSVEPPRRVDAGAKPIKDWEGPPWSPNGSGLYVRDAKGRWRANFGGTELEPCRWCARGTRAT